MATSCLESVGVYVQIKDKQYIGGKYRQEVDI